MTPELHPEVNPLSRAWRERQAARGHLADPAPPFGPDARYGLMVEIGCHTRTAAFASPRDLARAIHRRRRGQALKLEDHRLVCGPCQADVVAVYTQDEAGGRAGFLGYAHLAGAGWRALRNELYAVEPNRAAHAEAVHG